MDWGVHLPHLGRGASREGLISFARRADQLGVHSGWVSDHIAWPAAVESSYPYTEDGSFPAGNDMPWLDPLATLLFVAGCTENLRLGPTVLILGYRPPVQTAKLVATLDVVSGGRAILGVGVGWMREEFEVLGMPFDHRGARADEQLEVFRVLFSDPAPSYSGTYYSFPEIRFEPKPVQEHIPVWVGGATDAAYRRVVRHGDVFHAAFQPLEELAAAWRRIGELADEAGRDRSELGFSVRWYLDPDSRMDPHKSLQGSPQQMLDRVAELRDVGVGHVLVDITAPGGVPGRIEAMEHFMAEVAPHAP
jgi:probable F420-dependent oxidoreductase